MYSKKKIKLHKTNLKIVTDIKNIINLKNQNSFISIYKNNQ